jgi:hypothetical protein
MTPSRPPLRRPACRLTVLVALACLSGLPTQASLAEEPPAARTPVARPGPPPLPTQLVYTSFTFLRANPLGLQSQLDLDWRIPLFNPGEDPILANNFLSLGVSPIVSPALARLGVTAKLQPLALLKLEARWEYLSWFGNFDLLQSFPDAGADFSDSGLRAAGQAGEAYAADGWQLTLDAELRGKLGPVIGRNRFRAARVEADLRPGDTVLYDPYFDLLLPGRGWFYVNDADLLLEVGEGLLLGARWAFMAADLPDGQDLSRATTHRVGPVLAWTFFDTPGSAFNRPTLLAMVNWHLVHPWRTGQDVSQAIPYALLGLSFGGQLFP